MRLPESFLRQAVDLADLGRKADANFDALTRELATYDKAIGGFRAIRSGATSNTNATVVAFNAVEYDYSGWFVTGTNRYLPLKAGVYHFDWLVYTSDALAAGKYWQAALFKNGIAEAWGNLHYANGVHSSPSKGSADVELDGIDDYVQIVIAHDKGSAANIYTNRELTFFTGHYVGGKP